MTEPVIRHLLTVKRDLGVDIYRSQILWGWRYATIAQWNLCSIKWIIPSHTESITTIPWHVFLHGRNFVDHIWHWHRQKLIAKALLHWRGQNTSCCYCHYWLLKVKNNPKLARLALRHGWTKSVASEKIQEERALNCAALSIE